MADIPKPTVIFFGSFLQYSARVLEMLHQSPLVEVVAVVTTPPQPAGRKQELNKTHVHQLAEKLKIPLATPESLTPETLKQTMTELGIERAHYLVTAGYGKLLPKSWLAYPLFWSLNIHFSLLPAYRGANPAEWALLRNEKETGTTVIEMSPSFDTGGIMSQKIIPIYPYDTRESLYQRLYELGGEMIPKILTHNLAPRPQPEQSPTPYAKRLGRDDGFIAWEGIKSAMMGLLVARNHLSPTLEKIVISATQVPDSYQSKDELTFVSALDIHRITRALAGFPGVWTLVPTTKGEVRMKILAAEIGKDELILEKVQLAGQQPATWNQVKNSITA